MHGPESSLLLLEGLRKEGSRPGLPPACFAGFAYGRVYMSVLLSQFVPHSSFPQGVHKSVLYVCISMAALQTGSPGPSCLRNYIACGQRSGLLGALQFIT